MWKTKTNLSQDVFPRLIFFNYPPSDRTFSMPSYSFSACLRLSLQSSKWIREEMRMEAVDYSFWRQDDNHNHHIHWHKYNMFSCYFFNRPNSCSTAFIRSPLKYYSINCKHCHWERCITMCVWNFVLKFIYFYVNMFNAFIYILPFDIHIFSGTVAEQKRYERRKRRRWKSGEKENKLFAENKKKGTFSFPKKLKNWFCI